MSSNTIQTQYPLSRRKFWKKIIEKSGSSVVVLVICGVLSLVGLFALLPDASIKNLIVPAIAITLSSWCVLVLCYAWYVKAYIRHYYYDVNENFITIKKGVFAPAEIHVQYSKIQDVYVDQDILDRIMGLYDVHIASATATSAIEAHIDGVEKGSADGLKDLLLGKLRGMNTSETVPTMSENSAPNSVVHLTEEVSSKGYPILGRWLALQAIGCFIAACLMPGLLLFYFMIPGKNSNTSLMALLGIHGGTLFALWFVAATLYFVLSFSYQVFWRNTFSFNFLPEYLVLRRGVISRQETHLPYRSVQDVAVSQTIFERMFGLATVRIENAAAPVMIGKTMVSSALRIPGQSLGKANQLSEIVKRVALTKNSSQTGL
ncbi:MAG: PH domain-containing protein [Patescibacteria group bacterium]